MSKKKLKMHKAALGVGNDDPATYDHDLSLQWQSVVEVRIGRPFGNSFELMLIIPGALYVEGMAINHDGTTMDHGWIEHEGRLIDVTYPGRVLRYVPGIRLNAAALKHAFDTLPQVPGDFMGIGKDLPIWERFIAAGMGDVWEDCVRRTRKIIKKMMKENHPSLSPEAQREAMRLVEEFERTGIDVRPRQVYPRVISDESDD